jgi:hypothetical protein
VVYCGTVWGEEMSAYALETIQFGEDYRAVLSYDTDLCDTPRDWGNDISVAPIAANYRYSAPDDGVNALGDEVAAIAADWRDNGEDKLAKLMGLHKLAYKVVSLTAQRDWVGDFVFYGDDETVELSWIEAHADTVQQFYNGEVYRVEVEKKQVYKHITDENAPLLERWETVGYSLGGIYFDSGDSIEERNSEIVSYAYDILAEV